MCEKSALRASTIKRNIVSASEMRPVTRFLRPSVKHRKRNRAELAPSRMACLMRFIFRGGAVEFALLGAGNQRLKRKYLYVSAMAASAHRAIVPASASP